MNKSKAFFLLVLNGIVWLLTFVATLPFVLFRLLKRILVKSQ